MRLFYALLTAWLIVAVPAIILGIWFREIPFWPDFSKASSLEGTGIWAIIACWFYGTPLILFFYRRRANANAHQDF